VAGVGVREVMDYLTDYIGKLDASPVIMGHSFGGTFAQLLVGTNTLDEDASQAAYDRYAAPTPAKILFQGGFAAVTPHASTTFNFADDDRAPLLFISGGSDHILPTVLQDHNYKKNAKHSTAIAAHKVFPGRDHYTCGEPGWEAVADFALDWALAPVAGELG
jgi:dienelactone hydrolase